MAENTVPQTTEDLYQMLGNTPDLAGKLELRGDAVIRTFQTFWVYASLDANEGYIAVNRNTKHWRKSTQLLH